jgi:hypothetical protein
MADARRQGMFATFLAILFLMAFLAIGVVPPLL